MNDILDLSRIEAGRYELQEGPVDLRHSVASSLRLVAQRAQNKGIVLTQQIGPVPQVLADERALRQVLVNLLTNAVKFTPRGGRVEASVAVEPEGGVAIAVRDTGIGIPRADLDRVLEPFAQASNTRYNGETGTGLGLSIVRSLLDLHGGTVEISSELGKGTTVTARLPKGRVLGGKAPQGEPKAVG